MSQDPHESFENALAELQRTQERLQAARQKLHHNSTKVTSKDGMVTVTLDERGDVASIAFNTPKFRRLAPAELGSVLVETIRRARAESRNAMISAYRPLMPDGLDIEQIMSGKFSADGIFDNARRRVEQIMTDAQASTAASQADRKG
jgi:DNA-binding protein YbaB